MNKESFNPKETTCGQAIICKGIKDCLIEKTARYQLETSIKLVHTDYDNKTHKMDLKTAEIFLDNCVKTAGNCPNSTKIREDGKESIRKTFVFNS
jgi:hypothetical protein